MKRIIYLVVIAFLGATALNAQERDRDRIQDQDRTKLVMVNGEMLELKERAEMRLKEKATLSDGTIVSPDGTYIAKDGTKFRLNEGECLDGDGIKYRNEYQYRYKIQQENKGLTEVLVKERNQNRVHYTLVDGEMYLIRNQAQFRLNEKIELAEGISVNPDGSYLDRNRKQMQLRDGECINMEGQVYRNMHQHRKMLVKKHSMPHKKMIKKGVKKPVAPKKKKPTS